MLLIDCPWCGPRAEPEFRCGGESPIVRPPDPQATHDADWADYLFHRDNAQGASFERWHHRFGCGLWFNVARDTATHRITAVYGITDPRPAPEGQR
ncbi:MAG: sarcosine oxidase subunit delta [Sphingomonas sp.]